MLKDQCILVNDADRVVGHASKAAAHRFEGPNPNGLLHRAFSVFLFDPEGAARVLALPFLLRRRSTLNLSNLAGLS